MKKNKRKVTENSGNFVPPLLRKGDQSFSLRAPRQGKRRRLCQFSYLNLFCTQKINGHQIEAPSAFP